MQNPAADDREYWTRVLAVGGTTAVPRWVTDPAAGCRRARGADPRAELPARQGRRAARCSSPPTPPCWPRCPVRPTSSPATCPRAGNGRCRARCPPGRARGASCWTATRDAERELLAHADFPVRAAARAGPDRPSTRPCSRAAATCPTTPSVGVDRYRDAQLCVRYRRDALDAEAAARIAGYHLTALHRIATEPEAASDGHSLLSAEEVAFQIDGLAGPRRELPDLRFHELFEQRVRPHPEAVAAECARQALDLPGAQRAGQPDRARAARPRPGPGGRGRGDHRAQPRLDGRRCSRSSRPGASTSRSSRTCPPTGSRARSAAPTAGSCSPNRAARPPSTRRCDATPGVQRLLIEAAYAEAHAGDDLGRRRRPTSSPTSTSPPAPPVSPRARCASTPGCSTTSRPRSTTWRSARARSSPRPPRSASTSRSGS